MPKARSLGKGAELPCPPLEGLSLQIFPCSLTLRLSEPCLLVFLWRFHRPFLFFAGQEVGLNIPKF